MINFANMDDGESIFFQRELEYREVEAFNVLKAELKTFTLIPPSFDADPGASSIVYEQYDSYGRAKVISDFAADLPSANVSGQEFVAMIKALGTSFQYSLKEILAAKRAGKHLDAERARAALEVMQQLWDHIAAFGDPKFKIPGWLSNVNIPTASVAADGTGSSTLWVNKTPAQILRDMNALPNGITELTNEVHAPSRLVLPTAQYNLISSTSAGTGTDTSIKNFFLANNPYVKEVMSWSKLSAANLSDAGVTNFTGNIMVAYTASRRNLAFQMPQQFTQQQPQAKNLVFDVPCWSQTAGTTVYYPLSMAIGEGI